MFTIREELCSGGEHNEFLPFWLRRKPGSGPNHDSAFKYLALIMSFAFIILGSVEIYNAIPWTPWNIVAFFVLIGVAIVAVIFSQGSFNNPSNLNA